MLPAIAHVDDVRVNRDTAAPGELSQFFQVGSDFGKRSASINQAGASRSRPYALFGGDYRFSENTRGGMALGYANGQDKFENGLGQTKTKLTTLLAFTSTQLGDTGVGLEGVIGYGWGKVDSSRNIASLTRTATASTDGKGWSTALKASKSITLPNASILIPYLLFDAQVAHIDGYSESGAGFGVGVLLRKR